MGWSSQRVGRSSRKADTAQSDWLQESFPLEVAEDQFRRLVRLYGRGVDRELGVGRDLVRIGDAGEVLDDARSRPGVQALAVALFADLERRRHVHEHKPAVRLDRGADLPAGRIIGGDRRANGNPAVPCDLRRHKADPLDVQVAVRARIAELAGQFFAHEVAIEHRDGALPPFQELGQQNLDDGRLPRSGKPGEEDRDALLRARTVGSPQLVRDLRERDPVGRCLP